jgi:hypothetical protein
MIKRVHLRSAPLFAALFATSACAGDTAKFPSLAKRPIESQRDTAAVPPPPAPPVKASLSEEILARISKAVAEAQAGETEFDSLLSNARSSVSRAQDAAVGSESWVAAQMAISTLERSQIPVKTALSDIDDSWRRAIQANPDSDFGPVAKASEQVGAIDARQSSEVLTLLQQIKGR